MRKQFKDVDCKYGAPMGRPSYMKTQAPVSARIFKVKLYDGAYDDGGAYWGEPDNLWCARDKKDNVQLFYRAPNKQIVIGMLRKDYPNLIPRNF